MEMEGSADLNPLSLNFQTIKDTPAFCNPRTKFRQCVFEDLPNPNGAVLVPNWSRATRQ